MLSLSSGFSSDDTSEMPSEDATRCADALWSPVSSATRMFIPDACCSPCTAAAASGRTSSSKWNTVTWRGEEGGKRGDEGGRGGKRGGGLRERKVVEG